jgi:hypothetical protein
VSPDLYSQALNRLELLSFVEGVLASLRAGMIRARSVGVGDSARGSEARGLSGRRRGGLDRGRR